MAALSHVLASFACVEHVVDRGGSISDKRMQLIPGATLAVNHLAHYSSRPPAHPTTLSSAMLRSAFEKHAARE
jgi:hypothetical protein